MRWVPRASPHSAPTAAFSYFVLYESPGWVPCSERVDTPIDERSHCMISREQQKRQPLCRGSRGVGTPYSAQAL